MSEKKVWFITGTSSGLGRALAEEVLAQGFRVIATARRPEVLQDLVEKYPETARALKLDVTNLRNVKSSIANAVKEFGRIDVVVNNAGYGLVGAIEESSDEQVKHQFDTNVFGVLNVTREVLPILREQKSGHIVNISSLVGFSAFPAFGVYSATKFALEGVSEALAAEVAPHEPELDQQPHCRRPDTPTSRVRPEVDADLGVTSEGVDVEQGGGSDGGPVGIEGAEADHGGGRMLASDSPPRPQDRRAASRIRPPHGATSFRNTLSRPPLRTYDRSYSL